MTAEPLRCEKISISTNRTLFLSPNERIIKEKNKKSKNCINNRMVHRFKGSVCEEVTDMWHVETDYFALAIFLIMLMKEYIQRKENQGYKDLQSHAFFLVLVFSIINVGIDIISSIAQNEFQDWWSYEIFMTIYVMSMPLLAAVWVFYTYIMIHHDMPLPKMKKRLAYLFAPYGGYMMLAATNPVNSLFFNLTPDIHYSRGPMFMSVGVGFIMLYSFIGILLVAINHKKVEPQVNVFLLLSFYVTTICFIWIQLANPGWLIINASYAVVYVWCDITVEEQRRLALYKEIEEKNKELKATAKRAEAAAQAKTEFLSRMSHDIRTPMNAIIGLTHLADDETKLPVIKEYLHKIDTSSKFLLGLINDILDMSKIENGDLTLKKDPLGLEEFKEYINTIIRPLVEAKHQTFQLHLPSHIGKDIMVDRLRFNQIFFNLLSNAVKYTPEGGVIEFYTEKLPMKEGKQGLRFVVRDNGIGMSEEFQKHMYTPFSQERSALSDSSNGTGLGLSIVKSLVDAMGGTISVKSELRKGTEFTVDLYVEMVEAKSTEEAQQVSLERLKGKQILLVEDNEINIYVAQLILEKVGLVVTVAKNGKEAVDTFAQSAVHHFDAILMDVRMPVMDGLEATRQIRQLSRLDAASIPIIAMTADAFAEEQKKTIEAGMNYHLSKPIDPPLLYKILCEHL